MCHPLYPVAVGMVGRHVNVHHVSGTIYRGRLQSVSNQGIYVLPMGGQGLASAEKSNQTLGVNHALLKDQSGADLVFFPAAFFAFGALAGLTLGAAAASPYYYPYGYGAPYYW